MKRRLAWKVVCHGGWRLESAFTSRQAAIIYSSEKWATAPNWLASQGYHLTAFRSRRLARNFVRGFNVYSSMRIVRYRGGRQFQLV